MEIIVQRGSESSVMDRKKAMSNKDSMTRPLMAGRAHNGYELRLSKLIDEAISINDIVLIKREGI